MLMDWTWIPAWFDAALAGMGDPWTLALALALCTFLLEDVAIAAGVALAAQGLISWELSFAAVSGGIAAGDIGLYGLGIAATRWSWVERRFVGKRSQWARAQLARHLPGAIVLARVIPGLRLVTYTACGLFRVSFLNFFFWVLLAVAVWTASLYGVSVVVGHTLMQVFGLPLAAAVALPMLALAVAVPVMQKLRT